MSWRAVESKTDPPVAVALGAQVQVKKSDIANGDPLARGARTLETVHVVGDRATRKG